ncbi:unnamed protein product, partial [Meganyctiphanes norvegica]
MLSDSYTKSLNKTVPSISADVLRVTMPNRIRCSPQSTNQRFHKPVANSIAFVWDNNSIGPPHVLDLFSRIRDISRKQDCLLESYKVVYLTILHFFFTKIRIHVKRRVSSKSSVVKLSSCSRCPPYVFTTRSSTLECVVHFIAFPGSQVWFQPKVYLTIIAHTPFFKSQSQQVLVQGWLLTLHNIEDFFNSIHVKLSELESQLALATAQSYDHMEESVVFEDEEYSLDALGEVGGIPRNSKVLTNPMVSPDIGFVNMIRYGIVALQLLPENSSAGRVVITDGVISLPDATMFDSLLVELRNQTIACSFLQLGSLYHPQASLGYIPFSDLMQFLATATCGAYLVDLPPIEKEDYDYDMNDYHKALLAWGFQKFLLGLYPENGYLGYNRIFELQPVALEATKLIRKKERENPLSTSLNAVLSCRLKEGYTIKSVNICDDQIQLVLVLPWKYSIFIEYHIKTHWPPTTNVLHTQVWIQATYEFLNDVTNDVNRQFPSKYRQKMVAKYWNTLQHLKETDLLLVGLQSFASNPAYYTVPDCVKSGHPVFDRSPPTTFTINPSPAIDSQFPYFTNFWKPVCLLELNIWQKWMHTHRIGLILKHDHPLPKNLHISNINGRYGMVQCRQAELALTTLLTEWCHFVLIENETYIKFLYRGDDTEKPPISFFVVRITSRPPPGLVIRLAFLGGTPGYIRNKMLGDLKERILGLTIPSRPGGSTEVNKTSTPASYSQQDKKELNGLGVNETTNNSNAPNRPPLTRLGSNVPCCVITHKPIEKILIWYEKMPHSLITSIVQESPISPSSRSSYNGRLGATKSATNNMALLSRYLYHRRWIWSVGAPGAPSVSQNSLARILNTLTRMRLQEGFNFAHSSNGIITMVREFDMKLELRENDLCETGLVELLESCLEAGQETFPCVAQYVIFPPHLSNLTNSSVDVDSEEGDSVDADGELQLLTECWVEPQNGAVTTFSPHAKHLHNCNYRQLAQAF